MDASRLKKLAPFEGLAQKDLEQVARWAEQVDVPEGKALVTQGQFGYEFFAIEDGVADVVQDGERIRELGPGDFFGEIALLETERRTASVVARSPMQLVVLHRRDFKYVQRELPGVASRIEQAIRERYRTPAQ